MSCCSCSQSSCPLHTYFLMGVVHVCVHPGSLQMCTMWVASAAWNYTLHHTHLLTHMHMSYFSMGVCKILHVEGEGLGPFLAPTCECDQLCACMHVLIMHKCTWLCSVNTCMYLAHSVQAACMETKC